MKMKILNLIMIILVLSINLTAQTNWGPSQTDYRRDLWQYQSQNVQSNGLSTINTQYNIGRESGPTVRRAVYQWNIPDNEIPDNSSINLVRLVFDYSDGSSSSDLAANLYNISNDMISEDFFDEIFEEMDYAVDTIGYQMGTNHHIVLESSDPNNKLNQAISNMLINDKFVLGVKWANDSSPYNNNWYIQNWTLTLYIEYSPPTKLVTIDQRNSNNSRVGVLKKWEGLNWGNEFNPGSQFTFSVGSEQVFLGDQTIISNEKYNNWNNSPDVTNHQSFIINDNTDNLTSQFKHTNPEITIKNSLEGTSLDGGNIKFADPWYIDYVDPLFGGSPRNRGMMDTGPDMLQFRTRTSPFYPDYSTVYQNGNDPAHAYQGIFLNQDYNISGHPYYSVQALPSQSITLDPPIGTRKFYFFSWDYDSSKISLKDPFYSKTGVVFKDAGASIKANLKGHLLSNSQDALSAGSQRRLVRTDNGIYHLVYVSIGAIWYTHSLTTNFNGQWSDEVGLELGENPSMDFYGNTIKIVLEKSDADYSGDGILEVITIEPDYNNPLEYDYEDIAHFPLSYYGSVQAVITFNQLITYVAYRKNNSEGIYQSFCYNTDPWYERIIQGTNINSKNPSIKCSHYTKIVYLVYDNSTDIEYTKCIVDGNANWYYYPENISSGSGNNINHTPCISLASNYNVPVVSWIGRRSTSGIHKISGNSTGEIPPMVVVRRKGSKDWGSFFKASSNVVTVNNNSSGSGTEQTVITWSEENSGEYTSRWVRRIDTAYTDAHSLSSNGKQSQVSNGTDLSNMGGVLLSTTTTPYDLHILTTNFNQYFPAEPGGTNKIKKQPNLAYGREGIIYKNGIEFLFDIGDVIVADSVIKFIYRPDTITCTSVDELNEVLKTEVFHLNTSTDFYFTDFYYVLNPEAADTLLTEDDAVNFIVELVNVLSGDVAGTFDNVTFTKEKLNKHNNVSYQVDCRNIAPGDYYLRLVTTVEGDADYYLADVQNNEEELEKHTYSQVGIDGSKSPDTYDLSQNYPNPFNPATTINYHLPQTGFVTLKIYDILGKEVATLVSEQKNQGGYSVSFNASNLASGVYIYQLRVNDYVASKKMLLIK